MPLDKITLVPSQSVNFRGGVPPVDAIRETVTRLHNFINQSYKQYTWSMFQGQYDSVAAVEDPPTESVYADTTFTVSDQNGSQSFPSLKAFLAYVETHDYTTAYGYTRSTAPGESGSGFTLNMRPFASVDEHGSIEVRLSDPEELGWILSPVQIEVRRLVKESEDSTRALLEASFETSKQEQAQKPKRKFWQTFATVVAPLAGVVGILTFILKIAGVF